MKMMSKLLTVVAALASFSLLAATPIEIVRQDLWFNGVKSDFTQVAMGSAVASGQRIEQGTSKSREFPEELTKAVESALKKHQILLPE